MTPRPRPAVRLAPLICLCVIACPQEVPTLDPLPPGEPPEPPPPDLTEPLGPDEARAGWLTGEAAGALVGGLAGESRTGDLLLYNDRARFVLQGFRGGHNYVFTPATIIDADVVRPAGQADGDGLDDLGTLLGTGRLFTPDEIEVSDDGTAGGPAVVRATGHDGDFPFLEGVMELPGIFPDLKLDVVQTYTLQPGSPLLELTAEVTNAGSSEVEFQLIDAGIRNLSAFAEFIPGVGIEGEIPDGGRTMVAMLSRRNDVALALVPDEGMFPDEGALSLVNDMLGVSTGLGPEVTLQPGESATITRYLGVARDIAALEEARRGHQGLPAAVVSGVVAGEGSGAPVAGARVFLTDADGNPHTVAVTDPDGRYRIAWDPGPAWLVTVGDGPNEQVDLPAGSGQYGSQAHADHNATVLSAYDSPDPTAVAPLADGYGRGDPVDVELTEGTELAQDLVLSPPARLVVRVRDEDGEPLPAVVHVRFPAGVSDPRPADGRLGERRPYGGARKTAWVRTGEMTVPLPAGTYDVEAHRGFRQEAARVDDVELVAGEETEVELTLSAAVETPGWLAFDPHLHGPANDGRVSMEERVVGSVAHDLDVQVSTDHDQAIDYGPLVDAMGLDDLLLPLAGVEVSTVLRGHFCIFPVDVDPDASNGGAPTWWLLEEPSTPALFDDMRSRVGEDGVISVAHGRDPGMFSFSGYEPDTGEAFDEDRYDDGFDAMEILNRNGYPDADLLRADWCGHLDAGLRPAPFGVSDSHSLLPGPGSARTYVYVGPEAADDPTASDVLEGIHAGRTQVSAGPFVDLEARAADGSTAGPGDTLEAAAATLHLRVLAPSFVDVDEVRVYGSGCQLLESFAVDPQAEPPLWFEGEIDVAADGPGPAYYFVEVVGDGSLAPVFPGAHAYALTGAVFLESP